MNPLYQCTSKGTGVVKGSTPMKKSAGDFSWWESMPRFFTGWMTRKSPGPQKRSSRKVPSWNTCKKKTEGERLNTDLPGEKVIKTWVVVVVGASVHKN